MLGDQKEEILHCLDVNVDVNVFVNSFKDHSDEKCGLEVFYIFS